MPIHVITFNESQDYVNLIHTRSINLEGVILPVTERFRTEWIGEDYFKPEEWKSSVIPLVKQGEEEGTVNSQLSMAMYMKRENFVILEMGQSDPIMLGKHVKVSNQFRGLVLVELPMDSAEPSKDDKSQWLKWHKFHSAANFNPKLKVGQVINRDDKLFILFTYSWHLFWTMKRHQ